ncbi:MAG TPA: FAD-binding protein [Patescibacteria group bacterium]|nr:FAD-binding protein [Patescibacteria group bacterium]
MKKIMVFGGRMPDIEGQIKELNAFCRLYLAGEIETEAWMISDQDLNMAQMTVTPEVSRIKLVKVRNPYVAEEYLAVIQALYGNTHYSPDTGPFLLFGSGSFVSALAVRAAYRLNGVSCVGVRKLRWQNERLLAEKMVYSGHLVAEFQLKKRPCCLAISPGFRDGSMIQASGVEPENFTVADLTVAAGDWPRTYRCDRTIDAAGLTAAALVLAVGWGIGSRENVRQTAELALQLGGELGGSRPVVMNAWLGMEQLLGTSGAVVAPEACLVFGASGSAAFKVGIEKSKWIAAVNCDENAPIFQYADVAICGDCREFISELLQYVNREQRSGDEIVYDRNSTAK